MRRSTEVMAGDVFTVTSGKGGVGKTTTAVNLAVALHRRGHSAAILDADLGMPNVALTLDVEAEATLHEVLAGDADVESAITDPAEGLGVVAGDPSLEAFAAADPQRLDRVVEILADRYRYVVVDTGGGLSYESILPIELGDEVLLVASPEPAAVGDAEKTRELADRFDVPVRGVVVTCATAETDAEAIASELGVDLLETVPFDAAVAESVTVRTPVARHAPTSDAGAAYNRLAKMLSADDEATTGALTDACADGEASDEVENEDGETDEDVATATSAAVERDDDSRRSDRAGGGIFSRIARLFG